MKRDGAGDQKLHHVGMDGGRVARVVVGEIKGEEDHKNQVHWLEVAFDCLSQRLKIIVTQTESGLFSRQQEKPRGRQSRAGLVVPQCPQCPRLLSPLSILST